MNRSFGVSDDSNDGPKRGTTNPQQAMVAPRAGGGATRSSLVGTTSGTTKTPSSLRSAVRNSAKIKARSSSIKASSQHQQPQQEMVGPNPKASPLPPSARDPPLPPKSALTTSGKGTGGGGVGTGEKAVGPRRVSVAAKTPAKSSTKDPPIRRDRSGLSRAQQQRLHASSSSINYVHEAQHQSQTQQTAATARSSRRASRRATVTAAAAARRASRSPLPPGSRESGGSGGVRAHHRRNSAAVGASSGHSTDLMNRSDPSAQTHRSAPGGARESSLRRATMMTMDRSDPSAGGTGSSSVRTRRNTSMLDRSDPTHNSSGRRRGSAGGTSKRRRSIKRPSQKQRAPPPPQSKRHPQEDDEDQITEDSEQSPQPQQQQVHATSAHTAASTDEHEEAEAAEAARSAVQQGIAMARRQSKQAKDEKDKWWKSWSRLSTSLTGGEKFLDGVEKNNESSPNIGTTTTTTTKEKKSKKKQRASISAKSSSHHASNNQDSNTNTIELLQALVNSDESDTRNSPLEDALGVSVPDLNLRQEDLVGESGEGDETSVMTGPSLTRSKSANDLPKEAQPQPQQQQQQQHQESTTTATKSTKGRQRMKDKKSKPTTRKAPNKGGRKSKQGEKINENSIADQSLTVSVLMNESETGRSKRTARTDPTTDVSNSDMGFSSSHLGGFAGRSIRSSGMVSAMSSLTGGSSSARLSSSFVAPSPTMSASINNKGGRGSRGAGGRQQQQQQRQQQCQQSSHNSIRMRADSETEDTVGAEHSTQASSSEPTFAEESHESSSGSPTRRNSRPVKELSSFLNEYDDLDALFTQGLEAVAIEEGSKETSTPSPEVEAGGSPSLEEKKSPSGSSKAKKRKSKAGDVLKRFMKNFDDLDILFSRKVIKEKSLSGSSDKQSKDDIEVGSKKSMRSMLTSSRSRRSLHHSNSDFGDDMELVPKGPLTTQSAHTPSLLTSHPNILKEMLTMSNDEIENLFAKEAAAKKAENLAARKKDAADHDKDKDMNASFNFTSIKDTMQQSKKKLAGASRDELSKISEEPSSARGDRRSQSSVELSLESPAQKQRSKHGVSARASLTMEDLMTPDLEYETDTEEEPLKKHNPLSKSENFHARRRKSNRERNKDKDHPFSKSENLHEARRSNTSRNEASIGSTQSPSLGSRRKSPGSTKVDQSSSPSSSSSPNRKPRSTKKGQSESAASGNMKGEAKQQPGRKSVPAESKLGEKASARRKSLSQRPQSAEATGQSARRRRSLSDRLNNEEEERPPVDSVEIINGQASEASTLQEPATNTELKTSGHSLPANLEGKETPSTPVDVLEILLERYGDYQGLDAAKAALTTDLLDIDYDTVKEIKQAKLNLANPKEEDERKRDIELKRRAFQRTNSLKREAAREEAAREVAALEKERRIEEAKGVFEEFFQPQNQAFSNQAGTSGLPSSNQASVPSKHETKGQSPPNVVLPTFMGPERRHSDAASFASYTVSRPSASAPSSVHSRMSLPSQIGGPASAFVPAKPSFNDSSSSIGDYDDTRSLYSERQWRPSTDDARSVFSEQPRRPVSELSGFRYSSGSVGQARSFQPVRKNQSEWVDSNYYGEEYYRHPNSNIGRNYDYRNPTNINEFEAQYYHSHPHLYPGMSHLYGMYSSPDILHYDQGYGQETLRQQYEDMLRATSHRSNSFAPPAGAGPPGFGPPGFGPAKFDGSGSMSLEDVFVRRFPAGDPRHPGGYRQPNHPRNRSTRDPCSSGGSSTEQRLSSSVHGDESEWEDFTEVARSGALQSIPWRSIRGLSYHQKLNETERDKKVASLMLDDTFHWRYHHAVSKGCPKSKNEYCCKADCCCKKCSPPWYHRPARGVLSSDEKEEDDEASYKGRTVGSLAMIADSVRLELTKAADSDSDDSLTYPSYDPGLDSQSVDDASLSSFAD